MLYSRKSYIAKILLTVNVVMIALSPWVFPLEPGAAAVDQWTPHGGFHYAWDAFNGLLGLPILLYLLWGKLHSTGRSIRVVAFLSLAYIGSFFVASSMSGVIGPSVYDHSHQALLVGIDGYVIILAISFVMTISATLLSIKGRQD